MDIQSIIREQAQRYYPEQVALLQKFAKIDCGTGDEAGNAKVVDIVEQYLLRMGVDCERYYYQGVGTHLVGRIKPKHPTGKIIINSHLDTVFHPGDTARFPYHESDGWAWGLGIADCKGGFVCSAVAIRIMMELGKLPDKEIVMIYSCDEETGSHTGREIFERESKGAECAFVFEPARNQNGIITKRKGLALARFDVTGKEAHALLAPQDGASATLELARVIENLNRHRDPQHGILYNVGQMGGNESSLVVAGTAWCEAAVSLSSQDSLGIVQKDMEEIAASPSVSGCSIRSSLDLLFPTQDRTEGNVKLYEKVRKAGKLLGYEFPEEFSDGPSDACYFSTFGVPTVDGLGPYMRDIHTTNERLLLSKITERTELFCMVLETL